MAATAVKPKTKTTVQTRRQAPPKRIRRSPTEMLKDLQTQRVIIQTRYDAKLEKLNKQIASVETRYTRALALAELASVPEEELEQQLAQAKRDQKLMRLALKARR